MARPALGILSIIIGAAFIFHPANILGAEKPEIEIVLEFTKNVYTFGEPIGAKVMVVHNSGKDLLLSRGFRSMDFFLNMRIVDPAQRLVLARHHKIHDEFPDAPPLPFILYKKEPARAIQCEALMAGSKWVEASEDISDHYALNLPGEYSAQIQISVATFEDEPCNTKNYRWLGVLTSNAAKFHIEPADNKKQTARLSDQRGKEMHPAAVPANLVAYHQPSADIVYSKFIAPFTSFESTPLKFSNKRSFPIILAAGNDRRIPSADLAVPAQSAGVPVDSAVEIDVSNADSRRVVVIMHVMGTEVYNTLAPDPIAAYQHTQRIDTDASTFTLIYQDPQTDFTNCQQVEVVVKAYKKNKPNELYTHIFNFETTCMIANDGDADGISDETEGTLHTNKEVKTLFVRPKMVQGSKFAYWPGFISLFPDTRAGFAKIPAFDEAKIEISVIGAAGHPYAPMRSFDYDPASDNNRPACDILEITYLPDGLYCTFGHHNFGHTYFYNTATTEPTWYWDTKGYVPNDQTTGHYQKYGYFTPLIYPFPLDNYLKEGAYIRIESGQTPRETTGCGLNQCYDFIYSSSLNLNASDPVHGRPDGTVEFNDISFDSNSMQITYIGPDATGDPADGYDRDTVLKRTIVHEMGHALLGAAEADHCNDPECIMYHSVKDWKAWNFGPPASSGRKCIHSPGYSKDIRTPGVVHNRVH
jgi:hypothetical protein